MIYRKFGNTGAEVSALGFGCMRFPMIKDGDKNIVDDEKAIPMLHYGIDNGINYVDTALFYCENQSEYTVGRALKDGYREKVYLATKCPIGDQSDAKFYRETLETQLKKLDTPYIDFYHFHGISLDRFNNIVVKNDLLKEAIRAKDEGLIKHISFSFHDEAPAIKEIIDRAEIMESMLCQYNLMDRRNADYITYAAEKGLGVTIMGPVGGGNLVEQSQIFHDMSQGNMTTVELALKFVLSQPGVSVALSGMENMQMVQDNIEYVSRFTPLNADEKVRVDKMLDEISEIAKLYCTGCDYCMPCPRGIKIPHLFNIMNLYRGYKLEARARERYRDVGEKEYAGAPPSACVECGLCEKKCPQKIKIIEQLKEVERTFG